MGIHKDRPETVHRVHLGKVAKDNDYGFRADTFSATLYDVHREVFRYFDPRRKMRVVMGPEEFRQLEREWHEYAAFTVPVHYQHRNGPLEIHGMTVQVVPWVKGLFVVPDQP